MSKQSYKFDFKKENRNGKVIGYPCLCWDYDGVRYEGLLDTGADNVVFPIDFLRLLEENNRVDIEDIYQNQKYSKTVGIGGEMYLTEPISIKIDLHVSKDKKIPMDIQINCCLPRNITEYRNYFKRQDEFPSIEQQYKVTKDTRFKKKLQDKAKYLQALKVRYNPPYLLGKPFMSKFSKLSFVVNGKKADHGSYYEIEFN